MPRYDERLELAPRDVVARAIQAEMRGRGDSHVLLDISHKPSAEVRQPGSRAGPTKPAAVAFFCRAAERPHGPKCCPAVLQSGAPKRL